MRIVLTALSLTLLSPLLWAMSGSTRVLAGTHGGVSDAVWATLCLMGAFVLLCALILHADRPDILP